MHLTDHRKQKTRTISFLVDAASLWDDPALSYLLSFESVEGVTVEQHVRFEDRTTSRSAAIVGRNGESHVSVPAVRQFERFAQEICANPHCSVGSDTVLNAITLSHLAEAVSADAVVSGAWKVLRGRDHGYIRSRILSIPEALALLGAYLRQQETVPLGGIPLLVNQRSEVYPLTARCIIPIGQDWWSSCVSTSGSYQKDLIGLGQAVFSRVGQALRGRDGVHEALRTGTGRAAILDALYHFDVVLMSGVGALDALARVAHEVFCLKSQPFQAGWQRERWRKELNRFVPRVAEVVEPNSRLGAALNVLTNMRNSIHSIPLDEYLHVEVKSFDSKVEHRAMMSMELTDQVRKVAAPLGSMDRYGMFFSGSKFTYMHIGQFTEHLLSWTIEIANQLMEAMLSCPEFPPPPLHEPSSLYELEREYCANLAQVGTYPVCDSTKGARASGYLRHRTMAAIHNAHRKILEYDGRSSETG